MKLKEKAQIIVALRDVINILEKEIELLEKAKP